MVSSRLDGKYLIFRADFSFNFFFSNRISVCSLLRKLIANIYDVMAKCHEDYF